MVQKEYRKTDGRVGDSGIVVRYANIVSNTESVKDGYDRNSGTSTPSENKHSLKSVYTSVAHTNGYVPVWTT